MGRGGQREWVSTHLIGLVAVRGLAASAKGLFWRMMDRRQEDQEAESGPSTHCGQHGVSSALGGLIFPPAVTKGLTSF